MGFLTFILSVWAFFAVPQQDTLDKETSITVSTSSIEAFQPDNPSLRKFGALDFHGGLVLTSSCKSFGGISALTVLQDGEHFIAFTDHGSWLSGRIVYKDNRPVFVEDASMAPVLDGEGKNSARWDIESMAEDGDSFYIGLERINSIVRLNCGKDRFLARGKPIPVPPELKDLPFNQGLEGMVFVQKPHRLRGTLIAFSERALTPEGNLKAFLIGGPTPGEFAVKRTNHYDISDATLLPDGDILILERQYSLQRGVTMRIRRLSLDAVEPGVLLDGPALIETESRQQVDNMEAISAHRAKSGETVLTIMSDDNFSPAQRTLLLQFTLPSPQP
jgi:hypothetical protein